MYETLLTFAQTWGLMLFIALFAGALIYAFWPKSQARFDRAASLPLNEPDTPLDGMDNEDATHV
jgi:cytochrome c oxidase cbb3-type subunit 4